ncbi:ABC transporter substrate-binding protein [Hydrogenophaga sp.]|uniref:ABC transporter substrate-binding protein n=1 Tax=Hydrogenophaga sp. TaxID=1904254 RepID=UPI0035629C99
MTPSLSRRTTIALAAAVIAVASTGLAHAQKKYDTGVSDTEIKIGNIAPYSGPVSAYGTIAKAAGAYFKKVNADGGVNGRKINYLSMDDAYTPSKTVEQARKLVEQEEVFLLFLPIGTSHNQAIQRYMNAKKVPQLFVGSGATRWGDIKNFPWTMGWQPTYHAEGKVFGQHVLESNPDAKVAILMQNDDFGKDFYKGVLDGLGAKAETHIVSRQTFEVTDPTIDSQIVSAKGAGADVLIILATPKFSAMAIRKTGEMGWKPTRYVASVSVSVNSVLKPAGLDNAVGVISATYFRDSTDPASKGTPELTEYLAFMKQYYPDGNPDDSLNLIGYSAAQTLVQTLKQAGDNLTRENVMKQALNLSMTLPMLYPGIDLKTGPDDFFPIEKMQLIRFNGTRYEPIGGLFQGR